MREREADELRDRRPLGFAAHHAFGAGEVRASFGLEKECRV
jgi:hypothetical protein